MARLRGFEADLKLDPHKAQFETVLSIFSVGYILMMVPSYVLGHISSYLDIHPEVRNMLLHRLGKPSLYLPGCSIIWAIVSVCTGGFVLDSTPVLCSCRIRFYPKVISIIALTFSWALLISTPSFEGVVLCRFFLGFIEATFLPGALFTLSSWYTQSKYFHKSAGIQPNRYFLRGTRFADLPTMGWVDY